jgi:hypothetical protein
MIILQGGVVSERCYCLAFPHIRDRNQNKDRKEGREGRRKEGRKEGGKERRKKGRKKEKLDCCCHFRWVQVQGRRKEQGT